MLVFPFLAERKNNICYQVNKRLLKHCKTFWQFNIGAVRLQYKRFVDLQNDKRKTFLFYLTFFSKKYIEIKVCDFITLK